MPRPENPRDFAFGTLTGRTPFNALCGGRTLDDIEHRRNDRVFLDALGTRSIPDPTTAGDFCRRFDENHVDILQSAFNEARLSVWKRQPRG